VTGVDEVRIMGSIIDSKTDTKVLMAQLDQAKNFSRVQLFLTFYFV